MHNTIQTKQNIYHMPILCVQYLISFSFEHRTLYLTSYLLLVAMYTLFVTLVLLPFFLVLCYISYSNFGGCGEILVSKHRKTC